MSQTIREMEQLDSIVIRFAGDSGDGMQLTGTPIYQCVSGLWQ